MRGLGMTFSGKTVTPVPMGYGGFLRIDSSRVGEADSVLRLFPQEKTSPNVATPNVAALSLGGGEDSSEDEERNLGLVGLAAMLRLRIRDPLYTRFRFDKECREVNFVFDFLRHILCLNYSIFI
jgi:hypothetical protein